MNIFLKWLLLTFFAGGGYCVLVTVCRQNTDERSCPHPRLGYTIFDVEIHCAPCGPEVVAKYLSPRFRRRYVEGFLGDATPNLDQRGGNNRIDVDVSDEGVPASNAKLIRSQILAPFGIEWAICTGIHYNLSVLADIDYANEIASAFNRWIFEEFVEQDPAFLGVICVVLQDPSHAISEIEKWSSHPRAAEVFVSTAGNVPLGHRSFHPVYEVAAEHGLPVAAHTTMEGRGISGAPTSVGYCSRYLEFHSGLAASAMTICASLVCNGVFAKFPNFKFVLLEGGVSWALPLMWALDADWKHFCSEMPLLKELPSDYIKRQLFYSTQPIEEPALSKDIVAIYEQLEGATQIMFSSDYPHWDFDDPYHILPGKTSATLKRRILRENALDLYGGRVLLDHDNNVQ